MEGRNAGMGFTTIAWIGDIIMDVAKRANRETLGRSVDLFSRVEMC